MLKILGLVGQFVSFCGPHIAHWTYFVHACFRPLLYITQMVSLLFKFALFISDVSLITKRPLASSLAPPIFYVAKNLQLKDWQFPILWWNWPLLTKSGGCRLLLKNSLPLHRDAFAWEKGKCVKREFEMTFWIKSKLLKRLCNSFRVVKSFSEI